MQWLTHDKLGFNYRMNEMSAAVGVAQVRKIGSFITKRKKIAQYYIDHFKEIPEIRVPSIRSENESSWFVFPIKVKEKIRDQVIEKLKEKGIQSKAYFWPSIHLQPFYIETFGYKKGDFPITEKLSRETIVLPFYTDLSKEDLDKVVTAVKEIIEGFRW